MLFLFILSFSQGGVVPLSGNGVVMFQRNLNKLMNPEYSESETRSSAEEELMNRVTNSLQRAASSC